MRTGKSSSKSGSGVVQEVGPSALVNSKNHGRASGPLEGQWASVIAECSAPNWDGYGAVPVSRRAIRHAREILAGLGDVPEPEVDADPDGEASMNWYGGGGRVFSLSVSAKGRVSWAFMLGPEISDQGHGTLSATESAILAAKIRRVVDA